MASSLTPAERKHVAGGSFGPKEEDHENQGKSSFFQEHQAKLSNEGAKGYKHSPHAWRFAYRPPMMEPSSRGLSTKQKQQSRPTEAEQSEAEEMRHMNNVKIALESYKRANHGCDYEVSELLRRSTIMEAGSSYHHYSFTVYSRKLGGEIFFAEVDANVGGEDGVRLCCPVKLEREDHGHCHGCSNQRIFLIHPASGGYSQGVKFVPEVYTFEGYDDLDWEGEDFD